MRIATISSILCAVSAIEIKTIFRHANPTTSVVQYGDSCPYNCKSPVGTLPASSNNAKGGSVIAQSGTAASVASTTSLQDTNKQAGVINIAQNNLGQASSSASSLISGNVVVARPIGDSTSSSTYGTSDDSGRYNNIGSNSGNSNDNDNGLTGQAKVDSGLHVIVYATTISVSAVVETRVEVQAGKTITNLVTLPASVQTSQVTTVLQTTERASSSGIISVGPNASITPQLPMYANSSSSASIHATSSSATIASSSISSHGSLSEQLSSTTPTSSVASPTPSTMIFRAAGDDSKVMIVGPADGDASEVMFGDAATATPAQFIVNEDGTVIDSKTGFMLVYYTASGPTKRGLASSRFMLQKPGTNALAQAIKLAIQNAIINFLFGSPPHIAELAYNAGGALFIGDPGFATDPSLGLVPVSFKAEPIAAVSSSTASSSSFATSKDSSRASTTSSAASTISMTSTFNSSSKSSTSASSSAYVTGSAVPVMTYVYLKVNGNDPTAYVAQDKKPQGTPEQFKIGSSKALFKLYPDGTIHEASTDWLVDATYDPKYNNGFRYSIKEYLSIDVMAPVRFLLSGSQISLFFGPTARPAQVQSDASGLLYISDRGQSWPGESVITISVELAPQPAVSSTSSTVRATSSATNGIPQPSTVSDLTYAYLRVRGDNTYVSMDKAPTTTPEQFKVGTAKAMFKLYPDGTMHEATSDWLVDATYNTNLLNGFRYSVKEYLSIDKMTAVQYTLLGNNISFTFGPTSRLAQLYQKPSPLLIIADRGQYDSSLSPVDLVLEVVQSQSSSSTKTFATTTASNSTSRPAPTQYAASNTTTAIRATTTPYLVYNTTTTSRPTTTSMPFYNSTTATNATASPAPSQCPSGISAGAYNYGNSNFNLTCGTTIQSGQMIGYSTQGSLDSCAAWCERYGRSCGGFSWAQNSRCTLYTSVGATLASGSPWPVVVTRFVPLVAPCPVGYPSGPFVQKGQNFVTQCGRVVTGEFIASTQYSEITDCIDWFASWGAYASALNFDTTGPYQSCSLYRMVNSTSVSSTGTVIVRP